MKKWFETWFDTDYYHKLYGHRDEHEAAQFISQIFATLSLPKDATVLDLACGKGRHAHEIAKLGYHTIGVDLSKNSIKIAKQQYVLPNLKFAVHDMRNKMYINYFDVVCNLFTSFGYFENTYDNDKVWRAILAGMKQQGFLIIDFINTDYTLRNLVPQDIKIVGDIRFEQHRFIENNCIKKHIEVYDQDNHFTFSESVQILDRNYFLEQATKYKLKVVAEYGSYQLDAINDNSTRYIIVLKK